MVADPTLVSGNDLKILLPCEIGSPTLSFESSNPNREAWHSICFTVIA